MTNREKRKVLKIGNLVHLKYENNRTRVVEVIEAETDEQKTLLKDNPNLIFVVQTDGYSKSGLSKSRRESVRRKENTRTFDIDKIKSVKELRVAS
jgi:hypothetical protein